MPLLIRLLRYMYMSSRTGQQLPEQRPLTRRGQPNAMFEPYDIGVPGSQLREVDTSKQ